MLLTCIHHLYLSPEACSKTLYKKINKLQIRELIVASLEHPNQEILGTLVELKQPIYHADGNGRNKG